MKNLTRAIFALALALAVPSVSFAADRAEKNPEKSEERSDGKSAEKSQDAAAKTSAKSSAQSAKTAAKTAKANAPKSSSKTASSDKIAAAEKIAANLLNAQDAATIDASAKGIAPLEAGETGETAEKRAVPAGAIARDGDVMPLFKDEIAKDAEKKSPELAATAGLVKTAAPEAEANPLNELLETPKKETSVPWLRTVLAFLFVSSLIVLAGSFLRKRSQIFAGKNTDASAFRIRQTIPMGLKRQIVSVDFEGAHLLLGVSESNMQLLYAHTPTGAPVTANTVTPALRDFASHLDPTAEALANLTDSLASTVPPPKKVPTLTEQVAMAVKELKPLGTRTTGEEFRPEPLEAQVQAGDSWAKKRVH